MKELKLIIDANVLVSAYSSAGCTQERWKTGLGSHKLIISPEIFGEVERTLRQTEFELTSEEIKKHLKDILKRCTVVRPRTQFDECIADENDRHLANLALEIKADKILTGESALKESATIAGTPVMSFAQFIGQELVGARKS
jgi:putative PIN family toxin of toxin-antitoxin system